MVRSSAVMAIVLLTLGAAAASAQEARASMSFELTIPGMLVAKFHEAEGLGSESTVIEYRDGTTGETRKVPGLRKYGDITLKRGVTADLSLATWRALLEAGEHAAARKNGSIILFDQAGRAVARWNLVDAWPSKVTVHSDPETGRAIETLVLTVETIGRQ